MTSGLTCWWPTGVGVIALACAAALGCRSGPAPGPYEPFERVPVEAWPSLEDDLEVDGLLAACADALVYYDRVDLPLDEATDLSPLSKGLSGLEAEAERDMRGEGYEADQVQKGLELLVQEKDGDREVKLEAAYGIAQDAGALKEAVKEARSLLASNGTPYEGGMVLRMISLVSRAPVTHFQVTEVPKAEKDAESARKGNRRVFLDEKAGAREVPVYDRSRLTHGHRLEGPALVESDQTTVLVPEGWSLTVDAYNNAVLEEGA